MLVREIILLPTRPQAVPRLGRLRLFFLGISLEEHRFLASGPPVQRTGSVSGAPHTPLHHVKTPYLALCLHALFYSHHPAFDDLSLFTFSTTLLPHGAIIHHSLTARLGNKSISLACPLAVLVRCDRRGGLVPGMS